MKTSVRFILVLCVLFLSSHFVLAQTTEKAAFAGGCFWCIEAAYDHVDGVISATSGFAAQMESVEVVFDPAKVTYEQLLAIYWKNIDPTDPDGQFCDRGAQYHTAIFFYNDQQKAQAEKSKTDIETRLKKKAETPILQMTGFSAAPAEHQDYWKNHAMDYKSYKMRCQRDRKLRSIWGEDKEKDKEKGKQ